MSATTYEPAVREGDAEHATPAHVPAVSRQHRKIFAVVLAGLACVAIIALVGVGDSSRDQDELLGFTDRAASRAVHNRDVLQQLLAEVERVGSHVDGSTQAEPVELEQKASSPIKSKPCDASCEQRKKEIAARMKALRDQINHDFKAMTSFGHKAGYLPPPQSIKAQVMSGTLLSSGKGPVAPPPFNPDLASSKKSASSSKSSSASAAPASAPAPAPAPAVSDAAPPKDPPALPVTDSSSASLSSSSSSDDSSDNSSDDSSSSGGSSKGSSTWAKAFAFMHHTSNPVVGDKASRADTGSHHHASSSKKEDPLKAAESDKFLAGFEDPDSSDSSSAHKTKLHTSSSSSSLDDPDSPLDKGSDPLKSAETDKFLAGFLGGR